MIGCISNPPYNMKWSPPSPLAASCDPRFAWCGTPPKNNANYAFVLTALSRIDGKAAFVLPMGFTSGEGAEKEIRKALVEENMVEAVIALPDRMFESTSIPVCVVLFSRVKETARIEFVDLRDRCDTEIRLQNGQYGGKSHQGRTYKKEINVIPDDTIELTLNAIANNKSEAGFCRSVPLETVRNQNYRLTPAVYIEQEEQEDSRRSYEDIAKDINDIRNDKNCLKLTINETLAKGLGLYEVAQSMKKSNDLGIEESFAVVGQSVIKEDWIRLSKNKNEIKFENKSNDGASEILTMILQQWRSHMMYLSNRENILLMEFRDTLLPDLMNGKVDLSHAQD